MTTFAEKPFRHSSRHDEEDARQVNADKHPAAFRGPSPRRASSPAPFGRHQSPLRFLRDIPPSVSPLPARPATVWSPPSHSRLMRQHRRMTT